MRAGRLLAAIGVAAVLLAGCGKSSEEGNGEASEFQDLQRHLSQQAQQLRREYGEAPEYEVESP